MWEKNQLRRYKNKILNEVRDILDILHKCDDIGFQLPKFVVDSYDGLPPTSGFENIAVLLNLLLDELVTLRSD